MIAVGVSVLMPFCARAYTPNMQHFVSPVEVNKRWELQITGVAHPGLAGMGAYRDTKLSFTFSHPQLWYTIKSYAFWDGGEGTSSDPVRYKVRARFYKDGNWSWYSTCESGPCTEQNGLTGTVTVVQTAQGAPDLYRFGPLGLAHASWSDPQHGETNYFVPVLSGAPGDFVRPFFWIGDSAWAAPMRTDLSTNEWNSYLADRVAKGYTVVHVGPGTYWANPEGIAARKPFEQVVGCALWNPVEEEALPNKCSRMRLSFWQKFEQVVEMANQQGLIVLVTGLMEPVGGPKDCDYGCGGSNPDVDGEDQVDEDRYPKYAQARTFARNLTARLAGNHVVLSPGFDSKPVTANDQNGENVLELLKQVGQEIANTASISGQSFWGAPIISNHWGTASSTEMRSLSNEPWLTLQLIQSGANLGAGNDPDPFVNEHTQLLRVTGRARTLVPAVVDWTNSGEAMVLAESIYDEGEPVQGSPSGGRTYHRNRYRARHTAYLGFMTGSTGYSLGIGGVWDWGLCSLSAQLRPWFCSEYRAREGAWTTVSSGTSQVVSEDIRHFGEFIQTLDRGAGAGPAIFHREQSRILHPMGSPSDDLRMVALRDPHNFVAYLPRNNHILFDPAGINSTVASGRWWDPRDGVDISGGVGPKVVRCLSAGEQDCYVDWQWCSNHQGSCSYCGTGFLMSQIFACAFRPPVLNEDASLGENDYVLRFDVDPGYLSGWAGSSSQGLRAWRGRSEKGQLLGIDGALFSSVGEALSGALRLSDDEQSRQPERPSVARDGSGEFVVVWQDDVNSDGRKEVFLRWVNLDGTPKTPQVQVSGDSQSDNSEPTVAVDGIGNAVVAWTRRASTFSEIAIVWIAKDAGEVLVSDSIAHGSNGDEIGQPLITSTVEGVSTLAWVERNPTTLIAELRSQRFSGQLVLLGAESVLSSGVAEWIVPLRAYTSPAGVATVEWEALGGSGGDRLVRAEVNAGTGSLISSEVVLHTFAVDDEPPVVE